jgi:hypothetical protein
VAYPCLHFLRLARKETEKLSGLRIKLSHLTSKKVPALALVLVGVVGMIAGVIAANIVTTSTTYTESEGTYRNNTGAITVTDKGLAVVANAVSSNISTAVTWGATGTDKQVYNALTAGNWMNYFEFTTTLTDSSTHTATITIRSGTGPLGGTTLATVTTATWTAPSATSTAKITVYVDLGVLTITAPLTVYVSVT